MALETVLLKLHTKLAPGWELIRENFDPIQEIVPKVGGGCSSFTRLWYKYLHVKVAGLAIVKSWVTIRPIKYLASCTRCAVILSFST